MAGSYNHCVDDKGRLEKPNRVCGMLETRSGDVYEAVEEMYGMIWWLAERVAESGYQDGAWAELSEEVRAGVKADWVESARQEYKDGLSLSPGVRGKIR